MCMPHAEPVGSTVWCSGHDMHLTLYLLCMQDSEGSPDSVFNGWSTGREVVRPYIHIYIRTYTYTHENACTTTYTLHLQGLMLLCSIWYSNCLHSTLSRRLGPLRRANGKWRRPWGRKKYDKQSNLNRCRYPCHNLCYLIYRMLINGCYTSQSATVRMVFISQRGWGSEVLLMAISSPTPQFSNRKQNGKTTDCCLPLLGLISVTGCHQQDFSLSASLNQYQCSRPIDV